MTDRHPLQPLNPELRAKLLREMPVPQELDENDSPIPIGLSDEERRAAVNPGLPAPPKEKSMQPLVSEKFAALAGAIALALAGAAAIAPKFAFLPPWVPFAIWCLAAVAAYLAGKALPAFEGVAPSVPMWLVPILKSAGALLTGYAGTLAPGALQSGVMLAAVVLGALAGKSEPPPTVAPTFLPPPSKF